MTNYGTIIDNQLHLAPRAFMLNGVWQMKGFTIPGTGKAAFPNTRIKPKETP